MRAIVVDDEGHIRLTTKTLLEALCPDVEIAGEASSVASAIDLIRELSPDLVFLDVEMQDGTGFDVLSRLSTYPFRVIFITAHDDYAIKAFRFAALDYLLKPVDADELLKAVDRARQQIQVKEPREMQMEVVRSHQGRLGERQKIVLSDSDNIHLVQIEDIIRCESEANYTHFYLSSGEKILISKPLKEYDRLLSDQDFFRSHQSHLINLRHFLKYEKKDGGCAILTNGDRVPVSTRKKDTLINLLRNG